MKIPIPSCNNNRRTSMKCRRMCCRKVKPKIKDSTIQTILNGSTRPSKKIYRWDDFAEL